MTVLLLLLAALAAGACRQAAEPPPSRESAVPTPGPPGIRGQLAPALIADLKPVPEVFRTAPLT